MPGRADNKHSKRVIIDKSSTDQEYPIFDFSRIDRNGPFAFDVSRKDFDSADLLQKMVDYSSMTWAEIKMQRHDMGKSKHHFLDYDGMSHEARKRVELLVDEEEMDSVFSFALNNTTRVIGIRRGAVFCILWYDPKHRFYPSKK